MTLEIKKYPDPILRKKSERIEEITDDIKKNIQNMIDTKRSGRGIGLAAPQIGILKRIIVVRFGEEPRAFINPEILKKAKETEIGEEGCLSFPELFLKIKRAKRIEVKTLDENGKEICIKAEGLLARIFQHEIDHLNGILFIDHVRVGPRLWELLKFFIKRKKQ